MVTENSRWIPPDSPSSFSILLLCMFVLAALSKAHLIPSTQISREKAKA